MIPHFTLTIFQVVQRVFYTSFYEVHNYTKNESHQIKIKRKEERKKN